MAVKPLGKLEKVDLREAWQNEAGDFTPWLAKEANLALLSDVLGVELELEGTEVGVGPFRADLVCKDTVTGHRVVVENQLYPTDHNHLGQLLTYAAGHDATTVVWITPQFTDQHHAALDWLNRITGEDFGFFGLEVELWRIGDSPPAPKFNVVSRPNPSNKIVPPPPTTDTQEKHLQYWTAFADYLHTHGGPLRRPQPGVWMDFPIGRSEFWLATGIKPKDKQIGVWLSMGGHQAKVHFGLLAQGRDSIEQEMGQVLEWQERPGKKQSDVGLLKPDTDPSNEADWPNQHRWLAESLGMFDRVFRPRVKALNADDYVPEEDESAQASTEGG